MNFMKGSITVYLSLTLTVILSLFAAMLRSVQIQAGRAMIYSATEQSLFSMFSMYHKELLEEYDLFFIDGGYGTDSLLLGNIYDGIREDALLSLNPLGHGSLGNINYFGADIEEGTLTAFNLATDRMGNSLVAQICAYMEKTIGITGVQQLFDFLESSRQEANTALEQKDSVLQGDVFEEYDKSLLEGQEALEASENAGGENGGSSFGEEEVIIDENELHKPEIPVKNPIEIIRELMDRGILTLVTGDSENLSKESFHDMEKPRERSLLTGMGISETAEISSFSKLFLIEYAMKKFSHYTNQTSEDKLKYQIEYFIGKNDSDIENLREVADRLFVMREAANIVYLYADTESRTAVDALAQGIAASFAFPVAAPVISLLLIGVWAMAESILDLRELFQGGKVPLIKTKETWKLGLSNLAEFGEYLNGSNEKSKNGLDYTMYLRMLLLLETEEWLTSGTMDLIEYNLNHAIPERKFKLDHCIDMIEVEIKWIVFSKEMVVTSDFAYF